jgi:hypothetical protein
MCQFRYNINTIESTLDQVPGDFHLKITNCDKMSIRTQNDQLEVILSN